MNQCLDHLMFRSPNPNKTRTLVRNEYENEFVIDDVIGYTYVANQKSRSYSIGLYRQQM